MVKVYDSEGAYVTSFPDMVQALNYKNIFGNKGWKVK